MALINDPTSRLLAVRIRRTRITNGWTLADLAAKIEDGPGEYDDRPHLSASQLSKVENAQRPISVPELNALAGALGVVPEYLVRRGELCPTCNQETTE
jgi:transcriptional regulator with XRE-family HTH domain